MMKMPWDSRMLRGWDICGMNHYRANGRRALFVSMTRNGKCIKAEGEDETNVWDDLEMQASFSGEPLIERRPDGSERELYGEAT